MKAFLPPLLACGALVTGLVSALVGDSGPSAPAGRAPQDALGLRLHPFGLMDSVRRTDLEVPMGVQAYASGDQVLRLQRLEVLRPDGAVLVSERLDGRALVGDGGFVDRIHWAMESLPPDLTHRRMHRLHLPLEAVPELGPEAQAALLREVVQGVRTLQASGAPQLANLRFRLDLAQLFGDGAQPGDVADFVVRVTAVDEGGTPVVAELEHALTLLPPHMGPPAGRTAALGGGGWYKGDLHVHNCRDQAVGGCDSCAAESFNITGSYSNADLKSQFQALGFDFFSTTTHSYCINSDAEFQDVYNESQTLTDPNFVLLCGTEISGREAGPQSGSDGADTLCALGFGEDVHHMGGHGITSRRPGGDDGFLDFCDRPINAQSYNWSQVNAEGGFTVANHPAADFWAYNSTGYLKGQEGGGLTGVEVWNASDNRTHAQPYHLDWWRDRIRDGHLLYLYSGSDTHDAAFDFGATHVYVPGGLTYQGLLDALKGGRTYLSNGPFLEMEVTCSDGTVLRMGDAVRCPATGQLTIEVFYNLPAGYTFTLDVYRGAPGSESIVHQVTGLTGGGSVSFQDAATRGRRYYRAEVHDGAWTQTALTNPVFMLLR